MLGYKIAAMTAATITMAASSAISAIGNRVLFMARKRRANLTSEEREQIVHLYKSGIPGTEIARKLTIEPSSVYRILEKSDVSVKPAGAGLLTREQIDGVPALYEKYGTLKKTASAMGVHYGTVHLHLHRNDPKRKRGRKGPTTKAERRLVLRLYAKHGTYAAVRRETGISLPAITKIVTEGTLH